MGTLLAPFAICLAGLIVHALPSNAKTSEAGRLAYFSGLFWVVYLLSRASIHF